MNHHPHICFVDDEPNVCEAVAEILQQHGWNGTCFGSAEDCLAELIADSCDLLITDFKLPGMSGIELLEKTALDTPWIPVILVSGYGNIHVVKQAMRLGAVDVLEKPLTSKCLVPAIQNALNAAGPHARVVGDVLSATEHKVLALILLGMSNDQIAHVVNRSVGTIEVHRKHIMRKLQARNVVDLAIKSMTFGYRPLPHRIAAQGTPPSASQPEE